MADDPHHSDLPIQLQGQLLLADPSLRDGIFNRSVILLAEHGADDRRVRPDPQPPDRKNRRRFPQGRGIRCRCSSLPSTTAARSPPTNSRFRPSGGAKNKACAGPSGSPPKAAVTHAHRPGRIVRAFIGYSGWTAGQLENELRRNSWIAARPQPDLLGQVHDPQLWTELLRRISPLHRILAEAPDDPTLN